MKRINCLLLLVSFLLFRSNSTLAQKYENLHFPEYDSLLLVLKFSKADSTRANILNKLAGRAFFTIRTSNGKDYEPAIKYANNALQIASKINKKNSIMTSLYTLGVITHENIDYTGSLRYFFNSKKIAEEINDQKSMANILWQIGSVYSDLGNYAEAIDYTSRSITINEQLKIEDAYPHRIAGIAYQKSGNYTEALKHFFAAYKISEIKPRNAKGIFYRLIGNVYRLMGNFDEAMKYHMASLNNTLETTNYPVHLAWHYTDIGLLYNDMADQSDSLGKSKMYNEGVSYLRKGLEFAIKTGTKTTILDAYLGLAKAYKGIDDYNNALRYQTLYLQLKDSVFNNDLYLKISEVKFESELEKEQLKEKTREQLLLANQKAIQAKLLSEQGFLKEKILFDEKIANEKAKEQRLIYEKVIATEKSNQEKLRAEKQKTNSLLLMGLIIVVLTSIFLLLYFRQRQLKKRAIDRADSVRKMAELEMQSLRSQLNPHFMFNSLNSIQTLILKEDNDRSQSYLSRFARLLRMLLENAEKPFVPLQKEIDFLQLYLSLESLRVPDLQYSISTDPTINTEKTLIPNMILQPYVENAIWHGLSYKETDKQLQIRINRDNGTIKYEIEDNGVGRKKAEELKSLFRQQHQSKGMELLNKRFKLLNGEYNSSIETFITDVIKNNEIAGTLVTVKIPVQISLPQTN